MDPFTTALAARDLHGRADALREQARAAAALAQSVVWNSLGGAAFRGRALAVCLDLTTLSARLDAAAAGLATLRCPP